MEFKDYYKTLGLSKSASADDIKKAYRKLARKYHPDVSKEPNAEEQFKAVKEAYEVLKDEEKRKAYDTLGSNYKSGHGFEPPPQWEQRDFHSQTDPEHAAQFSDFFESLFGAQRQGGFRQQSMRGKDIHATIPLTVQESVKGIEKAIHLPTNEVTPEGFINRATKTLKVKIPPGCKPKQKIRLKRQGQPGLGQGTSGDLYLTVDIQSAPPYDVKGSDVYQTVPISPWEAALGASIEIETLHGKLRVKIPENTQGGDKLRLKGKGLGKTHPGDTYLVLHIALPSAKDPKMKAIYEEMKANNQFNPRQTKERA